MYDLNAKQWSFIRPMPMALMRMSAVTTDRGVYIVGGIAHGLDRDSLQDSVYAFDLRKDWTELPAMTEKRAFCWAVPVQPDLWLVGGVVELKAEVKCSTRIDVLRLASYTLERRCDMPSPRHSVCLAKIANYKGDAA
ncbi:beta-scruin-like [Amblyomma americanum]